jgi:hypothetical protein
MFYIVNFCYGKKVKKVLKNTLVKCTAFFSTFLGNYRGRFAPKVSGFRTFGKTSEIPLGKANGVR